MDEIKEGDKAKCIDDYFQENGVIELSKLSLPKKGESYIIRKIIGTEDKKAILLKEIYNNAHRGYEPAFLAHRFKYYSE